MKRQKNLWTIHILLFPWKALWISNLWENSPEKSVMEYLSLKVSLKDNKEVSSV